MYKQIPIKQRMKAFGTMKGFGDKGERDLKLFLNQKSYRVLDLNFKAPCDTCDKIQDWHIFNKLPDFLVKDKAGEIFFADAKAKTSRSFVINERDYDEYINKLEFLTLKVYFLIYSKDKKKLLEIFEHNVDKEKSKFPIEIQWDGNKTVNVGGAIKQVF